jgi:hypothetical protein
MAETLAVMAWQWLLVQAWEPEMAWICLFSQQESQDMQPGM